MKLRQLPTNINFSIPYEVMIDTRLNLSSRVLFAEVLAMSQKHGYCYANNNHFADVLGISLRTINRSIKELEEVGYIRVQDPTSKMRQIYPITQQPIQPKQPRQNDAVKTKPSSKPRQNVAVEKSEPRQNDAVVENQPRQNDAVTPLPAGIRPLEHVNVVKLAQEPRQIGTATAPICPKNEAIGNYIGNQLDTSTANAVAPAAPAGGLQDGTSTDEKPDNRRTDINELITAFEEKMDLKMPRMQFQRRAAHTLIARHGLPIMLRSIDAVVAVRDEQFAPTILSLEDLRDKWNNLTEFYRTSQAKSKSKIKQAV